MNAVMVVPVRRSRPSSVTTPPTAMVPLVMALTVKVVPANPEPLSIIAVNAASGAFGDPMPSETMRTHVPSAATGATNRLA